MCSYLYINAVIYVYMYIIYVYMPAHNQLHIIYVCMYEHTQISALNDNKYHCKSKQLNSFALSHRRRTVSLALEVRSLEYLAL